MPGFRFLGFASGSLVALTVAQGAATAQATLTWGQPSGGGAPNASFSIIRVDPVANANLIAPAGVHLRASSLSGFNVTEPAGDTNVYDPTQHRITFIWDFGEPGYTPRFTPNIPTAWRNTNVAYGKAVSHVFSSPGNKTVTCFAFDEAGNWGTATYTFGPSGNAGPILDPEVVFAGSKTVCYDPDNNFTGAPPNAVLRTTISGANSELINAGTQARLMLRRGQTYTIPRGSNGLGKESGTVLHVSAYGTGAAPVVNNVTGGFTMKDLVVGAFSDIDMDGGWDPTTETGNAGEIFAGLGRYVNVLVYHRCRISGMAEITTSTTGSPVSDRFYNDTVITAWKDYGVSFTPGRVAFMGADVAQHVDALMGIAQGTSSQVPTNLGNTHGPFRTGALVHFYAGCSSFFSRNGWSNNGSGGALPTLPQNTVRFTPGPLTVRTHEVHERCSHEGAGLTIGVQSVGDPESTTYGQNRVFDKCLFVGSAYGAADLGGAPVSNAMFFLRSPGNTVRNCYFYRPNVPRAVTSNIFPNGIAAVLVTSGSIAASAGAPSRFYNNTAWIPGPTSQIGTAAPVFFNVNGTNDVVQNNVFYAPDLTTPIGASFAPLGASPLAGFQCRFKGGRWSPPPIGGVGSPTGTLSVTARRENPGVPGTLQAGTVANGESIILPYPNYTGQAGYTLNVTQALITGNPTQRHQLSITDFGTKRLTDSTLWPGSIGGVTISFQSSFIRVTNNTGSSWTSGDVWLQLDLTPQLMGFASGTASPADVPGLIPQAGSPLIVANRNTGAWAHDGFLADYREGVKTPPSGAIQTGKTHKQGAFA
jgi:hypothetical protein